MTEQLDLNKETMITFKDLAFNHNNPPRTSTEMWEIPTFSTNKHGLTVRRLSSSILREW